MGFFSDIVINYQAHESYFQILEEKTLLKYAKHKLSEPS